jgi:hypothetical protein
LQRERNAPCKRFDAFPQVVSGFSDHGPVSIERVMRLDCLTRTWHSHQVALPVGPHVDYSDGLYGHSLVAHGNTLVLFGGLLSGASVKQSRRPETLRLIRWKQAAIRTNATGCSL